MGGDTTFIEIKAKPVLEEESGINAFGNPYIFSHTDQSYTYEVTTGNRRRIIELILDGSPRIMVTRYSRESEGLKDAEYLKQAGINPDEFSRMDSFSLYWDEGRPLTPAEILERYKTPLEDVRFNIRGTSGELVGIDEEIMVDTVLMDVEQNRRWDRCFIEEFRDMLEKYKVRIEWKGKSI